MLFSRNQTFLKHLDRAAPLQLVRRTPSLSRAEIAKRTGLTKSTVGSPVGELVAEGWLSQGSVVANITGRPSTPLSLNDDQLVILGAELGRDSTSVLPVTPGGQLLDRQYVNLDRGAGHTPYSPEEVIANPVNIFNPASVIVGGALAELGDALLQPPCEEARRFGFASVTPCSSGRDACALGAARWVMHDAFSHTSPARLAGD